MTIEGEPLDFGESETNGVFYLKVTRRGERDILLYAHEYGNGINQQHDFPGLSWDRWTHVAVVREALTQSVTLYYDGVPVETFRYGRPPENPREALCMIVGARSSTAEAYRGKIDGLGLFERTLAPAEVETLAAMPGLRGRGLVQSLMEVARVTPEFVDPYRGDYHLRSARGRYWPEQDLWVLDSVTSPCIDGGDPNTTVGEEPAPNGGRINMGAYGGTAYASLSEVPRLLWRSPLRYNRDILSFELDAGHGDRPILMVTFYVNGEAIAEDSNPGNGWAFELRGVGSQDLEIYALLTYVDGQTYRSNRIVIEVGPRLATPSPRR